MKSYLLEEDWKYSKELCDFCNRIRKMDGK